MQESVEAWHLLGTTQAKNEHDAAAIAALKSALELDSGNSSAQMALAVSYTNEAYQAQACHMLQGGHGLIDCLQGVTSAYYYGTEYGVGKRLE